MGDPGNVGTVIRSAHALADGPVVLGPGCADPFAPKAVRASMGSLFARPPAPVRARGASRHHDRARTPADAPLGGGRRSVHRRSVLCVGGEREGLPADVVDAADAAAAIPMRADGPESLNVAMARHRPQTRER